MFLITSNTRVARPPALSPAVMNAADILERDISRRLISSGDAKSLISLVPSPMSRPEEFTVTVSDGAMSVAACDDLGFVYGLLYISEKFLGIPPFWFWMDVKLQRLPPVAVPEGSYKGKKPAVKYRGWFINDEVLISRWSVNGDSAEPWRMAFEALLRCGGNMVIPGTDKDSHRYRALASSYGLIITHHHAEALGAEFFLREYPDLEPNYDDHPELFQKQWEDAVLAQKDMRVVWCLGFRGQGDSPFWANDTTGKYDTDEKRGAMISSMIRLQRAIVEKHVASPVFCTNLYGEVMELYARGLVDIDPDIIKIRADNGFGKMVTRRRGSHDPRVSSLPAEPEERGGIYYHASFYDLQAAAHITMLPVSVDFVNSELDRVFSKNLSEYWLINCSNIRPHAYMLDAIRKKWFGEELSDDSHSLRFAATYFGGSEKIARCYREYAPAQLPFGPEPDQRAGEQFYCELPRTVVHQFFHDRLSPASALRWLTDAGTLSGQVRYFASLCKNALPGLAALWDKCRDAGGEPIALQSHLQLLGAMAGVKLGEGFEHLENNDYLHAFISFGDAARLFLDADVALRSSERGVFAGFYRNDCFADYKHTAFMLQKLMGYVRELGDSPAHDGWYRLAYMSKRDRPIRVLLVEDNHPTDWELYLKFKENEGAIT